MNNLSFNNTDESVGKTTLKVFNFSVIYIPNVGKSHGSVTGSDKRLNESDLFWKVNFTLNDSRLNSFHYLEEFVSLCLTSPIFSAFYHLHKHTHPHTDEDHQSGSPT